MIYQTIVVQIKSLELQLQVGNLFDREFRELVNVVVNDVNVFLCGLFFKKKYLELKQK